ncbi:MAG: hypothetical protein GX096_02330 [Clostridiales bacterium]|nr:hypothetical protein [Clostridiales bacterium]
MPRSYQACYHARENISLQKEGESFTVSDQIARGHSSTKQIIPGMWLTESELYFSSNTVLREDYAKKRLFQISFCMEGLMEWDYRW